MILGFTGTRAGLTQAQRAAFPGLIATYPTVFIHGGAPGADEWADAYFAVGCTGTRIEVYPTGDARHCYWLGQRGPREVHPPRAPLTRNRIIAERCDHLLACPVTSTEVLRSGTWATVRYDRAVGKPITLLLPDGTVVEERR